MRLLSTLSVLSTIGLYSDRIHASERSISSLQPCSQEEAILHPHFCSFMNRAIENPQKFASELYQWSKHIGLTIEHDVSPDNITSQSRLLRASSSKAALPIVTAHGMGDSCFNDGMKSITAHIASLTQSYGTCIPTGDNLHDDTINGYFMSMDENIEIFAKKVKEDPNLKNGFHAIGMSQGNNVIRGYIALYNDPPVHTFISINGVNAGVSAVPYCIPSLEKIEAEAPPLHNKICDALMEVASRKAYSDFAQSKSFQANYWRDPRPVEKENYMKYSQLAKLGNERSRQEERNSQLNENFLKTQQFVFVLATEDTIVWPKEGEQFGCPNPNAKDPFTDILPMRECDWYKNDLFGLKSADEQNKIHFEEFDGNHLHFEISDLDRWVMKYILEK